MLRNVFDLQNHGLAMKFLLRCLNAGTFYVTLNNYIFQVGKCISSRPETIAWEINLLGCVLGHMPEPHTCGLAQLSRGE